MVSVIVYDREREREIWLVIFPNIFLYWKMATVITGVKVAFRKNCQIVWGNFPILTNKSTTTTTTVTTTYSRKRTTLGKFQQQQIRKSVSRKIPFINKFIWKILQATFIGEISTTVAVAVTVTVTVAFAFAFALFCCFNIAWG